MPVLVCGICLTLFKNEVVFECECVKLRIENSKEIRKKIATLFIYCC